MSDAIVILYYYAMVIQTIDNQLHCIHSLYTRVAIDYNVIADSISNTDTPHVPIYTIKQIPQ